MAHRFFLWAPPLLLSSLAIVSCGSEDGSDAGYGAEHGTDDVPGGGDAGAGSGTGGGSGDDLGGNGDDGSGLGRAGFRFGVNLGNPNFDDATLSTLASEVGVRSIRLKYPEYHFDNWGQEIEVGDAEHYASVGMKDHVAFLIGMTEEHSTAPGGSEDWERDYYIPKNLYEPIFLESGEVNPDNYYAAYLFATFSTYEPWVKYWEIFNEPDWVEDWQVTLDWDTEPPSADELVRFHGSIFDYVRMLRIASAVRDVAAPGTYILTGGLGYPSFLNALLRYTDNPDGGAVSDRYPLKGGDYFDVLSIHHYPHLVEQGGSDAALQSFIDARDAFLAELEAAGQGDKGWMVTENGAAHEAISGSASGPVYAPNYLQKSMIWAKAEGFLGVDWFTLSDGSNASDPFSRMGLYEPLGAIDDASAAVPTISGESYLGVSSLLADARLDVAATEALGLPDTARGYVFRAGDDSVVALWATSNDTDANLSVSVPSEVALTPVGGATIEPVAGAVTVTLHESVVLLTSAP